MTMLGATQRVEATGVFAPSALRLLRSSGRDLQIKRLMQAFSGLSDRAGAIRRTLALSPVSIRAEIFARQALGLVLFRPLLSTRISAVAFAPEVPWGNDDWALGEYPPATEIPWGNNLQASSGDDDQTQGAYSPGFRAVFGFRDAGPPLVMTVRGGRHTFKCDSAFARLL